MGDKAVAKDTVKKAGVPTVPGSDGPVETEGDALGVAIQPDGKIIVVGNNANPANVDFKIVRYNANGTLDMSFDGDGVC